VQTISQLSGEERALAMERFQLLEPHLGGQKDLRSISQGAEISVRTLQRWVVGYKRAGLAGLVKKGRTDRGERRAISPRLRDAIEGLALEKPALPLTSVHRQVKHFAQMIGEAAPSYWVVRDIALSIPNNLRTLAQQGARRYGELYDLVHRREESRPNALWQADHAQLDILLLREDGATARPWLTAIIDDHSRAIAGFYLSFDPPSSLRTSLALRQGIWRKAEPHWQICGIPDVLYTDNGADFTSKHLDQVAIDLKMRLVFSTPGKPQGRGKIERFFRTVNETFLCDLEGYTRRGRRKPTLSLGQLEERFRTFLIEVYSRTPVAEAELSPSALWERGGFLPRMPDSLEQLDLLLIEEVRSRRIRRDGIHFHGFRYLSLTLAAYVGEDITIRYDPRDMAEIRVFYKDRFLCRAICAELAGETVPYRDIIRVRNSRRKQLRKVLEEKQKTVDVLLQLKRGENIVKASPSTTADSPSGVRIKRYRND
jgi:putative transposase